VCYGRGFKTWHRVTQVMVLKDTLESLYLPYLTDHTVNVMSSEEKDDRA